MAAGRPGKFGNKFGRDGVAIAEDIPQHSFIPLLSFFLSFLCLCVAQVSVGCHVTYKEEE